MSEDMLKRHEEKVKQKKWLTPNELFREYGFSESTQAKYRMNRKIPFSKIGNKYIRYDRDEIEKWIASHSIDVIAS